MGIFSPTNIIFAGFEFELVIKSSFCPFWFSFIYWWWFVVVLRLEDYLTLFLLIFGFIELFTFLWKTCLVEKVLNFKLIIIKPDSFNVSIVIELLFFKFCLLLAQIVPYLGYISFTINCLMMIFFLFFGFVGWVLTNKHQSFRNIFRFQWWQITHNPFWGFGMEMVAPLLFVNLD